MTRDALFPIHPADGMPASLWTAPGGGQPDYPPLEGDRAADVAVIGAGMVGLTAAVLLAEAGLDVTVLEARRVGRQVTGRSTAKVTSQHGLKYHRLAETFGLDAARVYGQANEAAIRDIEERARALAADGFDCRFEERSAVAYASSEDSVAGVQEEVATARRVGLPARFAASVDLPYEVAGAVVFDGQAQFDPYPYLRGLAHHLTHGPAHGVATGSGRRGAVFELTRVTDVDEGDPCRVVTPRGTVTARKVIVATHLPMLDRGLYFARTKPRAHCVLAGRLERPIAPGMFISVDSPTRSIRTFEDERGPWLVFLGESFPPAQEDTAALFASLEREMRERFPVASVEHRWTNEDYDSVDGLPLVGPLLPGSEHVSVATGFSAWGITNGAVAGRILAEDVLGQTSPVADLFTTSRFTLTASARTAAAEAFQTVKQLAERFFPRAPVNVQAIRPGEAVIGEYRGQRAGISRDEDGTLHAVSAICSHMGCQLGWNSAMRTWDCSCHGSAFTRDGVLLHGPAVEDLERLQLDGADLRAPTSDESRGEASGGEASGSEESRES